MIEEIFEHAADEAPRECCGLVIEDGDNKKYIRMENISPQEDEFMMDAKTFVKYQLTSKIKYVVHSHYGSNCHPSEHDKNVCKSLGVPYLIVSYPEKGEFIYDPH